MENRVVLHQTNPELPFPRLHQQAILVFPKYGVQGKMGLNLGLNIKARLFSNYL